MTLGFDCLKPRKLKEKKATNCTCQEIAGVGEKGEQRSLQESVLANVRELRIRKSLAAANISKKREPCTKIHKFLQS